MSRPDDIREEFKRLFRAESRLYRAPGRVNLIGEHTDYNDGFVMPAALDLCTWVSAAPRADRKLVVHSRNFSQRKEFDFDAPAHKAAGHWSDYVYGVAWALERAGLRLVGADMLICGDVPIGAGLSSSASIEVAVACALVDLSGRTMNPVQMAKLCQSAENDFVGMHCGIMDQFIACCGQAGRALMLDCRSLDYKLLPLKSGVRLVMCNSMVKHELASGQYNLRRQQCEAGVKALSRRRSDVKALRDVTLDQLEAQKRDLPEIVYKRCRHVISEDARVEAAAQALERGDLNALGKMMAESHRSLRDDYEVSCTELDTLVNLAAETEGVYGARMTGGGFGGCTVNLVADDQVEKFKSHISRKYERATGRKPDIYVCETAGAAGPVAEANQPARPAQHA